MTIDCSHPTAEQIPGLRSLWKEAFCDEDDFLNAFFSTAFHPERCLCVSRGEYPAAAIYWMDCTLRGEKVAYLYALATLEALRGQGLARQLLHRTHELLRSRGYTAALLVPGSRQLADWYQREGYEFCGGTGTFSCEAAPEPIALRPVTAAEYGALRTQYLPEGSVVQEEAALQFLTTQAKLYAGDNCLLAVQTTFRDTIVIPEYLGDPESAPGVLAALGHPKAPFHAPGSEISIAMFRPLTEDPIQPPTYFAFPFG